MLDWSNVTTLAVAAILTAGLYATMSFGLALVYGVMKIINLAHAATMMLAAFTVLTLNRSFGLDPIIGSILILPLYFVAGMTLYRFAVRRVAAVPIASLLLLFGTWLVAQNAAYLIWGSEDRVIPVKHAALAAEVAPSAVVELIANAGHFPHKDHPQRFVKVVNDFIRSTEPAVYHRGRWRALLKTGLHEPAVPEPTELRVVPG